MRFPDSGEFSMSCRRTPSDSPSRPSGYPLHDPTAFEPAASRSFRLRHRRHRFHHWLGHLHLAVGRTLDATHSYAPVFIGLGLLMPIALLAGTAAMAAWNR